MPLTADLRKFQQAVLQVKKYSRKAMPDILNNNMRKILIGGAGFEGLVQLTPKATAASIDADLKQMVTAVGKRGGTHSVPRIIAIAASDLTKMGIKPAGFDPASQAVWRNQVSQLAKAILNSRKRGASVIAAGWLEAALNFGAKGKGGAKLYAGGIAAQGFGVLPTETRLIATAHNVVPGADKISMPHLRRAIAGAIVDMRIYIRRKIGEAIAKAERT